jgi:hypothetical protein
VNIDKHEGTVVCGGAALNGDFLTASENGAFFLPGGTCLGVGVGGLTLGGGIGYNTHWAGLTCDHLLSSRIVTASGDLLDIDDTQNNDLFWACRGGAGGSFDINTQFKFSLVEVPQGTVAWYRYDWQGADAAEAVLSAFDSMMQTAPPALNAVAMAQATPIGSDGPRAAIHVMSRGQYIGPLDELDDLIRPLHSIANRTRDDFFDQPFWQTIRTVVTGEPEPHSYGDISRYADAPIPQDAISDMVDILVDAPSRDADDNGPNAAIWSIGWVGGDVVSSVSRTETAYVHRNATTLYRPTTVWPNDARPSVGTSSMPGPIRSSPRSIRIRRGRATRTSPTAVSRTGRSSTTPRTTNGWSTSRPSSIPATSSTTRKASRLVRKRAESNAGRVKCSRGSARTLSF